MKEQTKPGFEGVVALSESVNRGVLRPERPPWHDVGIAVRSAIVRIASRRSVTPPDELDSTQTLLDRTKAGDVDARERLFARFMPALQAWAHGRLPQRVRGLTDTHDVVQDTLIRAFERIDHIEYLHEGGFFAYLRTVLRRRIIDIIRQDAARPTGDCIPEDLEASGQSPFDQAVGAQIMDAYEAALESLNPQQRAAVTLRIEFGLAFKEVADAVGCPSANAARMLVSRAVLRLSEVMDDYRES